MTDDDLRRLWNDGQSIETIAVRARTTKWTIAGRVRRLRRREGTALWPWRDNPIKRRTGDDPRAPKPLRPGTPTLPPLASLEGHGETSRR